MNRYGKQGFVTAGVLAVFMALLQGCTTLDPVSGQRVWNMYSISDDVALGRSTLKANTEEMRKANVPINQDSRRLAQLENMVERLAAVSDLPQLPYSVVLYQTNIVNAAAAPGGSMMVFEGLYDEKLGLVNPDDENELAAVMAHEIAHVNCRHVTERLTKVSSAAALTEILAAVASNNNREQISTALRGIFVAGSTLLIPTYGRRDELEADRVGLFYMARAGYDPRAAPRIWKRASEKKGEQDSVSIFSTHPANQQRYDALMQALPQAMKEYARVTGGYPADYKPPPAR
jgi:predicted Zn-dependent protease